MLQSTSPHCPHTTTSFYCSSKPTTTMEEVWKDINLAALTDHHHHPLPPSRDGIILQDFLAAPFTDQPPPTPPPPPPRTRDTHAPATVLSLNSRLDFHFLDNSSNHHINANPFEALASSAPKRLQDSHGGSTDRRHKRMIKNRESAARSRARKQAYTNELELEVAHLLEENARLKRQQQQICVAAAAQLPKKHTLQRTSTAPF